MADEKVKQWIQEKLDNGISEERLKKTLKETDRDPSLVEEVSSAETPQKEETEDDPVDKLDDEDFETDSEEDGFDLNYVDDEEEEKEEDTEESDVENGEDEDQGPSLSLPSVSAPSFSTPSSRKIAGIAVVLLLITGIAYGGVNLMGSASVAGAVSDSLGTCTDGVGVKMYSVGVSNDRTVADVYTGEEVEAVLKVYSGGQKVGESSKTIDGRGIIRSDAVGERAVFHERGCSQPNATRSY